MRGTGRLGTLQVDFTSWEAELSSTDRLKSAHNPRVIESIDGVFVLLLWFFFRSFC